MSAAGPKKSVESDWFDTANRLWNQTAKAIQLLEGAPPERVPPCNEEEARPNFAITRALSSFLGAEEMDAMASGHPVVRFQGKEYLLIGDLADGGPIATREQYTNVECSFAHLFPDGRILRFREQIGTRDDLEVIGPGEKNAARAALINERCDSIARNIELGREGEDPEGPAGGLDLGGTSGCAGGLCEEGD